MIMSMGFERNHVVNALKATDNNLDRALDWIMSHGPDEANVTEAGGNSVTEYRDGNGSKLYFFFHFNYENFCFIFLDNIFVLQYTN